MATETDVTAWLATQHDAANVGAKCGAARAACGIH
jgi:hypothetical protein